MVTLDQLLVIPILLDLGGCVRTKRLIASTHVKALGLGLRRCVHSRPLYITAMNIRSLNPCPTARPKIACAAMTRELPPGVAAIDLGTNTFRLVSRGVQVVEYPRIGLGVDRTGRIEPASARRGMAALAAFARLVRARRLRVVGVVGTSALREAANGPAFCSAVERRFGWRVEIISGEEEAALTFEGATATLDLPKNRRVLISDVGGGSTELIWGEPPTSIIPHKGGGRKQYASLKLGSVRMTERFGTAGQVSTARLRALREGVRRVLRSSGVPWMKAGSVVGVGGTATTLAAILYGVDPYDEKQVHGARVPAESLDKMVEVLARMTPRERQFLPSLPKGRADIIVAGAAIQTEIVRLAGASEMIASDAGLLTGLILRRGSRGRQKSLARRAQKV